MFFFLNQLDAIFKNKRKNFVYFEEGKKKKKCNVTF